MNRKTLCNSCGGVRDCKKFNPDTGEYPCSCTKKDVGTVLPDAKQLEIHWKNGRDQHNS